MRESVVDGVPVFRPNKPSRGPLRACLVFRVGRSDETLATAGITHAVEHLALSGVGRQSYEWNGMVDATFTRFVVSGAPAEVVAYLGAVCGSLRDFPVHRLEPELRVLRTEERRHGSSPLSADLFQRYGAQGFGLIDMPELGLRRLSPEEVAGWAARHFNRSNGALWLSGPVPRGLRLELPDGEHTPAPSRQVVLPSLPACVGIGLDGAALSLIGDGTMGVGTGTRILRERAFRRLRHDLALTYAVEPFGVELGPDHILMQLVADATAEHSLAVRDALAETATDFIEHGPTAEEVADELGCATRAWAEDHAVLGWLERAATARLWDLEERPAEEVMERAQHLTANKVGHAWAVAAETSLMLCGRDLPELGHWPYVVDCSTAIEEGTELQPAPGSEECGLLRVGPQGLTWLPHPKAPVAVRFDDLVVVQRWENGDRLLIAPSGHRIGVIPSAWWGGGDLTSYIDERTPAHLAVDMGPGEPRKPAVQPPPPSPPRPVLSSPLRRIAKKRSSLTEAKR